MKSTKEYTILIDNI